jgi:hypothetical protein
MQKIVTFRYLFSKKPNDFNMLSLAHYLLYNRVKGEHTMTFEIGKEYEVRDGKKYEVLSIDGDKMLVSYSDGKKATLSVEIQARIVENIYFESRPKTYRTRKGSANVTPTWKLQSATGNYFRTIGYLASRATIAAEVNPRCEQSFVERYTALKGKSPVYRLQEVKYYRWFLKMNIVCKVPDFDYDLGYGVKFKTYKEGTGEIFNNNLIWELLEMGFDLGNTHDVDAIRNEVPEKYLGAFDEGYKSGVSVGTFRNGF